MVKTRRIYRYVVKNNNDNNIKIYDNVQPLLNEIGCTRHTISNFITKWGGKFPKTSKYYQRFKHLKISKPKTSIEIYDLIKMHNIRFVECGRIAILDKIKEFIL